MNLPISQITYHSRRNLTSPQSYSYLPLQQNPYLISPINNLKQQIIIQNELPSFSHLQMQSNFQRHQKINQNVENKYKEEIQQLKNKNKMLSQNLRHALQANNQLEQKISSFKQYKQQKQATHYGQITNINNQLNNLKRQYQNKCIFLTRQNQNKLNFLTKQYQNKQNCLKRQNQTLLIKNKQLQSLIYRINTLQHQIQKKNLLIDDLSFKMLTLNQTQMKLKLINVQQQQKNNQLNDISINYKLLQQKYIKLESLQLKKQKQSKQLVQKLKCAEQKLFFNLQQIESKNINISNLLRQFSQLKSKYQQICQKYESICQTNGQNTNKIYAKQHLIYTKQHQINELSSQIKQICKNSQHLYDQIREKKSQIQSLKLELNKKSLQLIQNQAKLQNIISNYQHQLIQQRNNYQDFSLNSINQFNKIIQDNIRLRQLNVVFQRKNQQLFIENSSFINQIKSITNDHQKNQSNLQNTIQMLNKQIQNLQQKCLEMCRMNEQYQSRRQDHLYSTMNSLESNRYIVKNDLTNKMPIKPENETYQKYLSFKPSQSSLLNKPSNKTNRTHTCQDQRDFSRRELDDSRQKQTNYFSNFTNNLKQKFKSNQNFFRGISADRYRSNTQSNQYQNRRDLRKSLGFYNKLTKQQNKSTSYKHNQQKYNQQKYNQQKYKQQKRKSLNPNYQQTNRSCQQDILKDDKILLLNKLDKMAIWSKPNLTSQQRQPLSLVYQNPNNIKTSQTSRTLLSINERNRGQLQRKKIHNLCLSNNLIQKNILKLQNNQIEQKMIINQRNQYENNSTLPITNSTLPINNYKTNYNQNTINSNVYNSCLKVLNQRR